MRAGLGGARGVNGLSGLLLVHGLIRVDNNGVRSGVWVFSLSSSMY